MASKHKFSKKTWLGICFLGFFFLVGLGSDLTYSKPDKQALEKENTTPKKEPLTYEITRKDSSSHIDRGLEIKRVTYDAVPNVQEPPSEGTIRNIADQILKNDPEVWHETTVFIRLPGTVKKHPAYASVVYELGGHRGTTVFGTENLVCSPWNDKLALDDPLCKEYLQD